MPFQNIFSKTQTHKELKCPNPSTPIIIDTREKNSLIATNLISKKANIKFEKLDVGDYEIGESLLERKTFSDLISSMVNKRLQKQLINLGKSKKPILLIESFGYNYKNYKVHENAIKGMLLSIATDFQIPIIYTKDQEDTSDFLILLAKKQEKAPQDYSTRPTKTLKNLQEQKQFILEGFPGIGPTLAKSLFQEYKSLKEIFSTKRSDLEKIKGFDKNKLDNFLRLLNE